MDIEDLHETVDFTHEPCGEDSVEVIASGVVKIECEECGYYMLKEFR